MTRLDEIKQQAQALKGDAHFQSVMLQCMGMLGLTEGKGSDIMGVIGMAYLWGVEDGKQKITFCMAPDADDTDQTDGE